MSILEVRGLTKTYGEGEAKVQALRGIDLSVARGEFVAVVGSSGSGKSTFLNLAGGLDVPDSGEVIVDGRNLQQLSERELTIFRRRKIGFVFQQYNLIPMLDARENILLPLRLDGRQGDEEYLQELVHLLGLEEKMKALPGQLSGGQQQRVAIARALAAKPSLILADEPTGNLDSRTSQDVTGLLRVTGERFSQTIVMITHNEEIAQSADRILRIEDGRLVK
ncbi:MAG TPA: ABC transporter ATP-binding protein [Candidatus Choladousia intestinavium]|uniref:ABC transporter ATP-binding protein n=1 Tax=Candidatus Choladousia intestinavium TaxID=2840727 RepID=A0A9D1DA13_9FIRM|nr:ABC transporter ATP-binding protein [Candidatus Choladousia intestinavium]